MVVSGRWAILVVFVALLLCLWPKDTRWNETMLYIQTTRVTSNETMLYIQTTRVTSNETMLYIQSTRVTSKHRHAGINMTHSLSFTDKGPSVQQKPSRRRKPTQKLAERLKQQEASKAADVTASSYSCNNNNNTNMW